MTESQPLSTESRRFLVVDDEALVSSFIARLLRRDGYEVDEAHSLRQAIEYLRENSYAVVLCDVRLDIEEGTEILPHVKQTQRDCLTIFITGFGSVDSAVRAIHEGAFDYISKPLDLADIEADLKAVVSRALKQREALRAKESPAIAIESQVEGSMVGHSAPMISVYRSLARAALTRENVLITGESGTGKELVAHGIHEKSPWADKPFVTVNCCALAENLLESELFGHVRGAFTGAIQGKRGLFEDANGGTLFLDEIGDISQALQVKLLRAIQEGEIKPVGSTETRMVDVRVIAATHRDLPQYVQEGKFREDLYYRLKVISIDMPPLRERMADLPELAKFFAARYARKTGKNLTGISEDAMELLKSYSWPGNVRELENAIGRAAAMTTTSVLFAEDFPPEIASGNVLSNAISSPTNQVDLSPPEVPSEPKQETAGPVQGDASTETVSSNAGQSLEDLERRHIAETLRSVNFNKSRAADILGIDRVTLYRKAFKYGLISKGGSRKGTATTTGP